MTESVWTNVTIRTQQHPAAEVTQTLEAIADELCDGFAPNIQELQGNTISWSCQGNANWGLQALDSILQTLIRNQVEFNVWDETKYDMPGTILEWRIGMDKPRRRRTESDAHVLTSQAFSDYGGHDPGVDPQTILDTLRTYFADLDWTVNQTSS